MGNRRAKIKANQFSRKALFRQLNPSDSDEDYEPVEEQKGDILHHIQHCFLCASYKNSNLTVTIGESKYEKQKKCAIEFCLLTMNLYSNSQLCLLNHNSPKFILIYLVSYYITQPDPFCNLPSNCTHSKCIGKFIEIFNFSEKLVKRRLKKKRVTKENRKVGRPKKLDLDKLLETDESDHGKKPFYYM